jgi:hypothetical protein
LRTLNRCLTVHREGLALGDWYALAMGTIAIHRREVDGRDETKRLAYNYDASRRRRGFT